MAAVYNEIDPHACEWLRNLIKAGVIAPGEVDERSIVDVRPDDYRGYTQVHLFAGIGVWSYALRLAGWPDDKPVWSASCPCPPFSNAGKRSRCPECDSDNLLPHVGRTGFFVCCACGHEWLADGRHLWPEVWRLARDRRPSILFGEQVASDRGVSWLALVRASLEIMSYALRASDWPSAGVGAPNVRQRLFFVADSTGAGLQEPPVEQSSGRSEVERPERFCDAGGMADPHGRVAGPQREQRSGEQRLVAQNDGALCMADAESERLHRRPNDGDSWRRQRASGQGCAAGELADTSRGGCGEFGRADRPRCSGHDDGGREDLRAGAVNGFWRDADWVGCTDGKWRPVEAGTFPLAPGAAFRMGSGCADLEGKSRTQMLRGYGNAINAEAAAAFIRAAM